MKTGIREWKDSNASALAAILSNEKILDMALYALLKE